MAIRSNSDNNRHRLAHDIARLSAEICLAGPNDPKHMIGHGVRALAEMVDSSPMAVAWMEQPIRNNHLPRMLYFASSNGEHLPEAPDRAWFYLSPNDFLENADHNQLCFRRADTTPDEEWQRSPLAKVRTAVGLFDYVLAITSCAGHGEPRLLHVELAGRTADWRPSAHDLDLVCATSIIMRVAYIHQTVIPDEARQELLARLTPTQRQVAMLLTENISEAEIAAIVQRSPHTVHDHVKAIFRAWGVHSRPEAIVLWRYPLDPNSNDAD